MLFRRVCILRDGDNRAVWWVSILGVANLFHAETHVELSSLVHRVDSCRQIAEGIVAGFRTLVDSDRTLL